MQAARTVAGLLAVLCACAPHVAATRLPCPCAAEWVCCEDYGYCAPTLAACEPPYEPHPELRSLAPGQAVRFGQVSCTTPVGEPAGQCRQAFGLSHWALSERHHALFVQGGGDITNTSWDGVMRFDLTTLAWSEVVPPSTCAETAAADNFDAERGAWKSGAQGPYPRPIAVAPLDGWALAPPSDRLFLTRRASISGGSPACGQVPKRFNSQLASFSLTTFDWRFAEDEVVGDSESGTILEAAEWDPIARVVWQVTHLGLWRIDPQTHRRTSVARWAMPLGGYEPNLIYFPPEDRFYVFEASQGSVARVHIDRRDASGSSLTALGGTFGSPRAIGALAYEPRTESIAGAVVDGRFSFYTPATGEWSAETMSLQRADEGPIANSVGQSMAYDRVNDVLWFLGADARAWAYRPSRGR